MFIHVLIIVCEIILEIEEGHNEKAVLEVKPEKQKEPEIIGAREPAG